MAKWLTMAWALSLLITGAAWAEGPAATASPDPQQQQAEEAMERARTHLGEAFKALKEAGGVVYDQNMPKIQEKSGQVVDEMMGETQKLLDDLQKNLKKSLPSDKIGPGLAPPAPPVDRERFI